ncbi:hypothetical protein BgiMline_013322, partial [Biomphalaria glabrata]
MDRYRSMKRLFLTSTVGEKNETKWKSRKTLKVFNKGSGGIDSGNRMNSENGTPMRQKSKTTNWERVQ